MKDTTILKFVALVVITLVILFNYVERAEAGGPWSNQYCDVEITQIKVVDQNNNVIENRTEEKLVCKDGASDFLFNMGIAENCEMYTWDMPVGEVIITQRQIACKKMDGTGYEIVQGYHGID
tara:strand:+ start:1373 stop:1738 length:366 start_codon:yes stop_codon:yes gene_type:complete